jgi:hypothetical protein
VTSVDEAPNGEADKHKLGDDFHMLFERLAFGIL